MDTLNNFVSVALSDGNRTLEGAARVQISFDYDMNTDDSYIDVKDVNVFICSGI